VKRNRWLVIDRGFCRVESIDDAAASRERTHLLHGSHSTGEFTGTEPTRTESTRTESTRTESARKAIPSRSEPHSLLVSSDGEPVYPQDTQGFERSLANEDAQFQDDVITTFQPVLRKVDTSVWADSHAFSCACTHEFDAVRTRFLTRTLREKLREVSRMPTRARESLTQMQGRQALRAKARKGSHGRGSIRSRLGALRLGGVPVWTYALVATVAFFLMLLARGAGTRLRQSIFQSVGQTFGTERSAWSTSTDSRTNDARHGVDVARLRALSPEPLRAFAEVVEAKLKREPSNYGRALLRLDASRASFPPQSLPSRAFIAAMAMYTMADDDLDSQPRWKAFLERLGPERTQGIGVVGYEASRVRKNLVRLVEALQARGSSSAKEQALGVWWAVEQGSSAAPVKTASGALEDALDGLARIERVFATVPENERVFRNLLSATAIADAVQLSWIEGHGGVRKVLETRLAKLADFAAQVPRPERDLLEFLIEERRKRLGSASIDVKALARERMDFVLRFQEEEKGLCVARENALLADFFLQTLRAFHVANLTPKAIAPWQQCFLGAKPFYAVEKAAFDGPAETTMLAYVPHTGPLPQNLRAHDRMFRGAAALLPKIGEASHANEASWHATAFLSGFLSQKSPWSAASFNERCKKKAMDAALCAQVAFRLDDDAADRLRILSKFQEDYKPEELAHLAFTVAVDVYTGRTRVNGKRTPDQGAYSKLGFSQYFSQTYPEFSALEWQMKNN